MAIANSDGSIILSVQIDKQELENALKQVENSGKKVSGHINSTEKSLSSLTSSLGKMASALGIVFSVRELIRFSNEAAQVASTTEASVQRIVEIYGEASKSVMDFINTATIAIGMSKSAAMSYASVYGNLFSIWADQKTNAELTNQYLNMTAVVASKTGRTVADVQERIRSGLLGNTEAIEDLGVFVNVKTIEMTNAFQRMANGRSWEQLGAYEQNQVRTLAILEQATQKYGNTVANTSVFARSSFTAAWEDFKATWGMAVNQVLMPVLKWLTMVLRYAQILLKVLFDLDITANVQNSINYSKISSGVNGLSDSQKDLTKSTKALKKETKELNKELAEFDNLAILSQKENKIDDVATPSTSGTIGGGVGGGIGDIDLDDVGTILDDDTLKKLQEFEQWVTEHKDAIKTGLEIAGLGLLGVAIAGVAKKIGNLLGLFKKKDNALDTQTNKTNTETSAVNAMSYAFSLVPALAYGVAYGLNKLGQGATDTVLALDGVTASAYDTVPAFEGATQGAYGVIPALDGVTDSANGTVPAFEGAGQSVTNYGTIVDTVMPQTETTAKKALDNTETNASSYSTATRKTFSSWATSVVTNVNAVTAAIGMGMYNALYSAGQNINSFVEATSQSIKDWAKSAGDNFVTTAKNIANSMANALASAWENWKSFKKATGEAISETWNKHKATITTVAVVGAIMAGAIALAPYTGGLSLGAVALANGAVLPPNQPFLAMVGDQKHGTNVEAPAELIKQMAKEAYQEMGLANNQQQQIIKEEHYNLNQTELMTIIYKLVKGGERLNGTSLVNQGGI